MKKMTKKNWILAWSLCAWSLAGVLWTIWHAYSKTPDDDSATRWQLASLGALGVPGILVVLFLPSRLFLRQEQAPRTPKKRKWRFNQMTNMQWAVFLMMCFGGILAHLIFKNLFGFDGFADTIWSFGTFFVMLGLGYFARNPIGEQRGKDTRAGSTSSPRRRRSS
jgi:MFS family permease